MRGSSESVPTFNRSLLPSAEYIGCRRYCSAAARRTPAVTVGWKIARPVLLLPRIPLRYALPGWVSKAGYQAIRNRQGAAAKREAEGIPEFPQLMKLHTWLSGPSHQLLPVQNPRNRRCERSGRSPECRRQAFFSYTIKRRILFFLGKGHPTKAQRSGFCGEEEGQRSGMRDALPRRASRI